MNLNEATTAIKQTGRLPSDTTFAVADGHIRTIAANLFGTPGNGEYSTPLGRYFVEAHHTLNLHNTKTFLVIVNGCVLGYAGDADIGRKIAMDHFIEVALIHWWMGIEYGVVG